MKKLYKKNELTFAIVWSMVYCVLQSLANPLNKAIGIAYAASAAFCVLQTIVLFTFIRKNDLQKRYGLCKTPVPAWRFLYYIPLVILASGNLWNGVALNYSPAATACRIVCMLCVGFLEEVIFRGLLFKAIAKDNIKSAVIISSVTFGIGHIINLFNGSGMELVNNLCQIIFAIAVGFLLVTIFYRGGSLLPCIIVHSVINMLGTFANDANLTTEMHLLHLVVLIVITVAYTLILTRTLPKNMEDKEMDNKASITALMSSFGRAFHAENEEHPVFSDHLAKNLMTEEEYTAVQGYILGGAQFFEPEIDPAALQPKELLRRLVNVHIAPSPLCRAAYTEKALKTAVLTDTKQYVILGAGMDTFAFREMEFLSKYRVFEADHPLTQADKLERITRAGWTIPDNLSFVPVDFTKDSLTERLIAAGFDLSVKSFFSWLGVTYYLSAEAIDTMLSALSSLCADGSSLVFDYPDENFFDAPEKRVQNTIMMAKAGGEPMQSAFSYAELEKLLEKHGFLIYELLTPDDIQRDIIDNAGADMKAFEHVNYCLAVRKK